MNIQPELVISCPTSYIVLISENKIIRHIQHCWFNIWSLLIQIDAPAALKVRKNLLMAEKGLF